MKSPSTYLTNTDTVTGRLQGEAVDNPGDNTGTGAAAETFNDNIYGHIAVIESYKQGGISDTNETTEVSDMRDALEEMVSRKVSGIDEWDSATTYTSETLVMRKGFQFFAYNTTGNLSKDPLLFPDYWYYAGDVNDLLKAYSKAEPLSGGLNDIADRNHTNYKQVSLVGQYRLGGNGDSFYNFYRVALDGTTVTGNTVLETLFDVDGSNQYFKLDKYAPEVTGTRTLIDKGDYVDTPQSNGGDADTVGELVEDQMQQITGTAIGGGNSLLLTQNDTDGPVEGAFSGNRSTDITGYTASVSNLKATIDSLTFDSADSPDARTGDTTHGKRFTVGSSHIIVMQEVIV